MPVVFAVHGASVGERSGMRNPGMPFLGVSQNRRKTTKMGWFISWKTLLKWDDLGGKPTIFGNIHIFIMRWGNFSLNLILGLILGLFCNTSPNLTGHVERISILKKNMIVKLGHFPR